MMLKTKTDEQKVLQKLRLFLRRFLSQGSGDFFFSESDA
jgi:hypothetical protein